jgi:HK97 family phage major capsid protein
MNLKSYKERRDALLEEAQNLIDDGNLEAAAEKKTEIESLDNDFEKQKAAKESLNALKDSVQIPDIVDTKSALDNTLKRKDIGVGSDAYRNAFFKHLLGQDDQMTQLENEAFTHTTTTTSAPLPTTMLNTIWDLVTGQHAIMGDITIYRTGTILEVVKHTEITQGKAKKVAEATANEDEQNTMVKVTLSGNDFSKHVNVSYAEAKMSVDALESYLTNEIASGLGEAMAEDTIQTISDGINSANKITTATSGEVTYSELAGAFGKLKRVGTCVAYMTRATLYNRLVAMTDGTGRPIFQPSLQTGAAGTLLGATIKIEDAVADDVILIGDPRRVTYNMVQDIMVETDKDIKSHVYTYSGYARGQGALIDDLSFAQLTVKA